jgi:hypothetical protein
VDLEIAVQAGFVETQYLHDIRSPAGGSPVRRHPPVCFYQYCVKQMSCQTGESLGDDSQSPFGGPLRIPPPVDRVGPRGDKNVMQGMLRWFHCETLPCRTPSFGGFPAATWMSQQSH